MPKQSLVEILSDGNKFDINQFQKELDKHLPVDTYENAITLSAHGLALVYDPERFEEETVEYVAEQLKVHRDYHELMRGRLLDSYGELNDILSDESDIEKDFQFVSEETIPPLIRTVKLLLAPMSWIRFRTLRGELKEAIEEKRYTATKYRVGESIVNYGLRFVDERLKLADNKFSEGVNSNLVEWAKIQKNLGYLYSRLVATADKRVQVGERMYKLLFPNSGDVIK